MKKSLLLITILTVFLLFGCTKLPLSEETGAGPGEYEGIVNTKEIKQENENLKEELNKTKTELEELEKEYEQLTKNNNNIVSLLEETQLKLNIIESEDIPEFKTENTEIDGIVEYLNDSSSLLADSVKGIEIISSKEDVIFRTIGYGDYYSQIFIWEEGQNEPALIKGAAFNKDGSYEWLDKYILIKTNNENKVLDVQNKKMSGTFKDAQKFQLIEGTSTILFMDKDNEFILYDFVHDITKQIDLKNNYTDFNLQNDIFVFTGSYIDDNGVSYEVKASVTVDKMKEVYEIMVEDEIIEVNEVIEEETGEDTV